MDLSLLLNHLLFLLKKKLDEVEGTVMRLLNKTAAYYDTYKHYDDLRANNIHVCFNIPIYYCVSIIILYISMYYDIFGYKLIMNY